MPVRLGERGCDRRGTSGRELLSEKAGEPGHSSVKNPSMKPATSCLRRDVVDIKPWTETCGQIRPLIEEKDDAAAELHHLEITSAKLHYHQRTDEIYYVIDGQGRMQLDDEQIELHSGVAVYVPRGVKHKAWGQLKV